MAREGKDDAARFWVRGIVPTGWIATSEPLVFEDDSGQLLDLDFLNIYLDGSGGMHTADRRVRRCGYAAVIIGPCEDYHLPAVPYHTYGSLAGRVQTVPRAGLLAAIEVLRKLVGSKCKIILNTDCAYVLNGFTKKKGLNGRGKNGDLWKEFHRLCKDRAANCGAIQVRKVMAHADHVHFVLGMTSWQDLAGNSLADAFAGRAANMACLNEEEVDKIMDLDKLTKKVQDRIIEATIMDIDSQKLDYTNKLDKSGKKKVDGISKVITDLKQIHDIEEGIAKGRPFWKCRKCLAIKKVAGRRRWRSNSSCVGSAEANQADAQPGINTDTWLILKKWALAACRGDEEQDLLAVRARSSVEACECDWDDFSKRSGFRHEGRRGQ